MMRERACLTFPCSRMIRNGDNVWSHAAPNPSSDPRFIDGSGGAVRGELAENGMKDIKFGSIEEDGMRYSCCSTAKSRS